MRKKNQFFENKKGCPGFFRFLVTTLLHGAQKGSKLKLSKNTALKRAFSGRGGCP
jgi:hypothetical protein